MGLSQYKLTHFSPVSHFYTPWKRQKTKGFLTFSGGIEMWHWTKVKNIQVFATEMFKVDNNIIPPIFADNFSKTKSKLKTLPRIVLFRPTCKKHV